MDESRDNLLKIKAWIDEHVKGKCPICNQNISWGYRGTTEIQLNEGSNLYAVLLTCPKCFHINLLSADLILRSCIESIEKAESF